MNLGSRLVMVGEGSESGSVKGYMVIVSVPAADSARSVARKVNVGRKKLRTTSAQT